MSIPGLPSLLCPIRATSYTVPDLLRSAIIALCAFDGVQHCGRRYAATQCTDPRDFRDDESADLLSGTRVVTKHVSVTFGKVRTSAKEQAHISKSSAETTRPVVHTLPATSEAYSYASSADLCDSVIYS